MKKITLLFFALVAFCWQSNAQSIASQQFYASGYDDDNFQLIINDSDITVNLGQPIQSITILNYEAHYNTTTGTQPCLAGYEWFYFDLVVTGGVATGLTVTEGCEDDYIGLDVSGFTNLTFTSNDPDVYSDLVHLYVTLEVTYQTPLCTQVIVDTTSVVDDCGNSQFSVDVDVTTVGDATHISNGTNTWPISGAGVVTVGPFDFTTTQALTVVHSDTACNLSLGNFSTGCTLPGEVCENAIVVASLPYTTTDNTGNYGNDYGNGTSPCSSYYMSGDDVFYSFTPATDGSFNVSLTGIGSTYSGLHVLDGCPGTSPTCVGFQGNSGTGDREFDVNLTGGSTYYIVISTWATPQTTAYTLNISENTCTNATVSYSVVNDCAVSGEFYVEVEITDMGTATDITLSDNQGSATQSVTATGTYQFGTYPLGTGVVITVTDDNDANCVQSSNSLTYTACPPSNDVCSNAIPVSCDDTVTGSTVLAADTGGANASKDVWYSYFNSGVEEDVTISLCNSGYDTHLAVFADCSGGTPIALNDDFCGTSGFRSELTFTSDGVTTYYIAVEGYHSGTGVGANGAFELTVSCAPAIPAPDNDLCANAEGVALGISASGTTEGATQNLTQEQPTCDTFGSIADVWYSFEITGTSDVTVTTTLGTATEANVAVYSNCGGLQADQEGCADDTAGEELSLAGLAAGTYYVRVWNNGSTEEGTFSIVVDATLSTNELDSQNLFSYYPNPVNSTLTLNAQRSIQSVSVMNMLGQEVLRVTPNTVNSVLDLSNLTSGSYFVNVTVEGVSETVRIIKN